MDYPALIMDGVKAQTYRDATAGKSYQLNPILIRGGEYLGQYMLPARVKTDENFDYLWDDLSELLEVVLDTDIAFPPVDPDSV